MAGPAVPAAQSHSRSDFTLSPVAETGAGFNPAFDRAISQPRWPGSDNGEDDDDDDDGDDVHSMKYSTDSGSKGEGRSEAYRDADETTSEDDQSSTMSRGESGSGSESGWSEGGSETSTRQAPSDRGGRELVLSPIVEKPSAPGRDGSDWAPSAASATGPRSSCGLELSPIVEKPSAAARRESDGTHSILSATGAVPRRVGTGAPTSPIEGGRPVRIRRNHLQLLVRRTSSIIEAGAGSEYVESDGGYSQSGGAGSNMVMTASTFPGDGGLGAVVGGSDGERRGGGFGSVSAGVGRSCLCRATPERCVWHPKSV